MIMIMKTTTPFAIFYKINKKGRKKQQKHFILLSKIKLYDINTILY